MRSFALKSRGRLSLATAGGRGHCLSRGLCFRHGGPLRVSQETATRGVQPLLGLGTVESQGGLAQSWVAVSWFEDGLVFFDLGVCVAYVPSQCCLR